MMRFMSGFTIAGGPVRIRIERFAGRQEHAMVMLWTLDRLRPAMHTNEKNAL